MATLQINPSSVPNAVQEWTRELNVSELGRVGYANINYTLWNETSTAVPNVIAGSIIEINNSLYLETGTVALNITGQTVDAINWVIYEVSGSTATAYLKPTAPTATDYDVDKGGFYNGSGYRYTGHYMYVSPAGTAYSNKGFLDYANGAMLKYRIDDEADVFVIDAKVGVKETLTVEGTTTLNDALLPVSPSTEGSTVIAASGTHTVPRGMYCLMQTAGSGFLYLEVYLNGSWETDGVTLYSIKFIASDGTNFRVRETVGSSTGTLRWRLF